LCCGLAALSLFLPDGQPPYEQLSWIAGLVSHWQWLFLLAGLPLCALALAGRRWHVVLPLLAIVAAFLHLAPAAPTADAPNTLEAGSERTLTVASANLNYARTE